MGYYADNCGNSNGAIFQNDSNQRYVMLSVNYGIVQALSINI